jgi:hypothetical protein
VFSVGAPAHLRPGLDPDASWRLRLSLARVDRARFGPDVVYTYGPWGYLDDPTAASRVGVALGLLFAVCAVTLTWWSFWRLLRPGLGPSRGAVLAAVGIAVVAAPLGVSNLLLAGIVALVAQYLTEGDWARHTWFPAAAAVAGAFLLQVKLSVGVCALAVAFLAAFFGPSRPVRRCLEAGAAAAVALPTTWLLAGQDLRDLPTWLSRSVNVVGGYSEAMGTDPRSRTPYAWAVVAVVLIGVALWRDSGELSRRTRLGLFTLAALSAYYGYRQGFGRFDVLHQPVFYLGILPFAVRALARRPRSVLRWGVLALVVLLGRNGTQVLHPGRAVDRWEMAARVAADGGYRDHVVERARAAALDDAALTPALRDRLGGHSVSVDGYETGLAWMAGLPMVAPPAFQSFVAYTTELDDLNAEWLRDRPAGHLILRPAYTAIDGRNSLWDPPGYVLDELCRTRVVAADTNWLLLSTGADRCLAPVDLGSRQVRAGETIPIPPGGPEAIVVMSFQPSGRDAFDALTALFAANSPPLHATVGGYPFRLPRALAGGPLVTSVPSALGWPQSHGGGTAYETVSFDRAGTVYFRSISIGATR